MAVCISQRGDCSSHGCATAGWWPDKAYETGIPQKLGEHANTARDTASAKYNDLTNQVCLSLHVPVEMPWCLGNVAIPDLTK